MYHLLTNCNQSSLLAVVCRLGLLVLNTSLAKCEGLCYAIQSNQRSFTTRGGLWPVTG